MFGKSIRIYSPVIFGSVLASLFTLFALSVNVSAQDAPDYLLGNLTFKSNLTKEETQEVVDKVTNYTTTMLNAANGNETKLSVLLFEDLAKRNIIDEEAKQGFLSFIASIPKPLMETQPGPLPGNLTIPGNTTDFLNDLNASSTILDEIAINNSDSERSQTVSLMTDILKKRVSDLGTFVSGNVTDIGPVTIGGEFPTSDFAKAVVITAAIYASGTPVTSAANAYMLYNLLK